MPSSNSHTRIRGHHLLCMQAFQGYGYSSDFVANMQQVIQNIDTHPDMQIEVVAECDIICTSCPHYNEGICQKTPNSHTSIVDMDLRVLKKLGLEEGTRLKSQDIFDLVNQKVQGNPDISDLCEECEWKGICFL